MQTAECKSESILHRLLKSIFVNVGGRINETKQSSRCKREFLFYMFLIVLFVFNACTKETLESSADTEWIIM